jgi:hypothetical protein
LENNPSVGLVRAEGVSLRASIGRRSPEAIQGVSIRASSHLFEVVAQIHEGGVNSIEGLEYEVEKRDSRSDLKTYKKFSH